MRRSDRTGLTLTEVVVSLALVGILSGALTMVLGANTRAMSTGTRSSELNTLALRGLDEICERLQSSSREQCDPQIETPWHTSTVDYQRAVARAGNAIVWGNPERIEFQYSPGELDDGVDNNGNGLIDEGRVVWLENPGLANERSVVLCNWVRELMEDETLDGTDENGNFLLDEGGLAFDFDGNRVTVGLTLERPDRQGVLITHTVQKTIAFRNWGS